MRPIPFSPSVQRRRERAALAARCVTMSPETTQVSTVFFFGFVLFLILLT